MQSSKGRLVQGTILIIDGVTTNRIMLKVLLSAAYYRVVPCADLESAAALAPQARPDLIISAMSLPDGTAMDLHRILQGDEALAGTPIIAITAQNDRNARLVALAAGIDDVMDNPLDDLILQARIRSLLRNRDSADDLSLRDGTSRALGFAEPPAGFATQADIALVTRQPATGALWSARLRGRRPHRLRLHQFGHAQDLMSEPPADVIVIELGGADAAGLRLLADLRARGATRHSALIGVAAASDRALVPEALDRGAHDVMQTGFCADELVLRLDTLLRRKASLDHLRDSVRNGLQAAVLDPMTGLYNRRYALPQIARIARQAGDTRQSFALMLADLDHFKRINDRFGHPAGDAVLTEAAQRLRGGLRPIDMIARVGGEEFMVALPGLDRDRAACTADLLCRRISSAPFLAQIAGGPAPVTTSIGVVIARPPVFAPGERGAPAVDQFVTSLIAQADRALYEAKNGGRNTVSMIGEAA